ncbi:MAG: hypothetical protein EBT92_14660 [Planctomycetes bacterium]|nr:hypothetical protein [Planctomycetota bacterium]NBY00996.1 hypothetical protein [Planctomycetota bacterium]
MKIHIGYPSGNIIWLIAKASVVLKLLGSINPCLLINPWSVLTAKLRYQTPAWAGPGLELWVRLSKP